MSNAINTIKKILKCERTLTDGSINQWEYEIEVSAWPEVFAKRDYCGSPRHEDKLHRDLVWKGRVSVLLGKETENKPNVRCVECANFTLNELLQNQSVRIANREDAEVIWQELKAHTK